MDAEVQAAKRVLQRAGYDISKLTRPVGGNVPAPICKFGYSRQQLQQILGERLEHFDKWMYGQGGVICEGREYDRANRIYVENGCGPHGRVVFEYDLTRYLRMTHR